MNEVLVHRGPDACGSYFDAETGVGLAHRRLSIIDLDSRSSQPMVSADGSMLMTYNGEIYNYQELRNELERDGVAFRTTSDTEVLLEGFRRSGPEFLARLNGIFAAAILDKREQTLYVFRDHFGVKPLYFAETAEGFVFASEMKALLKLNGDWKIDRAALVRYLTFLWSPGIDTIIESVKRLPPGYIMTVKDGKVASQRSFYDRSRTVLPDCRTVSDAVELVRARLRDAVKRQMVADVEVGAFLSGGVDSTAIVALATESANRPPRCFTMRLAGNAEASDGMGDDYRYARDFARSIGADLNVLEVDADDTTLLDRAIYHLDEPQADPSMLNVMLISKLAADSGLKVLLSGTGGDDIFGGYRRHIAIANEGYWSWLPRILRRGLAGSARSIPVGTPALRRIRKAMEYMDLPALDRLVSYYYWFNPKELRTVLSPTFHDVQMSKINGPMIDTLGSRNESALAAALRLEERHFLADHNLLYTDKGGMSAGVEIRVPFLDKDLVEGASGIPVGMKVRGSETKWILKKAVEPFVPKSILTRPKTGFGAPVRYWVRERMAPAISETLLSRNATDLGIFDRGNLQQLIEKNRRGVVDGSYLLFTAYWMQKWFDIFGRNVRM